MTNATNISDVKRRISKLLALAGNNPNEHEADSAMRMALKLLAKFDLTAADIKSANPSASFTADGIVEEEWVGTSYHDAPWARRIAYAIANLYYCSYYYRPAFGSRPGKKTRGGRQLNETYTVHVFVGQSHHAATAKSVAEWLIRSTNVEAHRQAKELGSQRSRFVTSFNKGASSSIRRRAFAMIQDAKEKGIDLSEDNDSSTALVAVSDLYAHTSGLNKGWLADRYSFEKKKSREHGASDYAGFAAGQDHGNKVHLGQQIK